MTGPRGNRVGAVTPAPAPLPTHMAAPTPTEGSRRAADCPTYVNARAGSRRGLAAIANVQKPMRKLGPRRRHEPSLRRCGVGGGIDVVNYNHRGKRRPSPALAVLHPAPRGVVRYTDVKNARPAHPYGGAPAT